MIDIYQANVNMPVDISDPVNRQHPLNRGRLAWWLTVPELAGGTFFYDLMGMFPGTLNNMAAGSGWASPTRPGGYGHLVFDGIDDFVLIGFATPTALQMTTRFSLAGWINVASLSTYYYVFGASNFSTDVNGFEFFITVTTGKPSFYVNGSASGDYLAGASAVSLNTWYRAVAVADGTNQYIYLNGVQVATQAQTLSCSWSIVNPLYIGAEKGNTNNPQIASRSNGRGDDFAIWNRALSPSEVAEDYNLSRVGYPGALNRIPPMFFSIPATVGTSSHLLSLRRRAVYS